MWVEDSGRPRGTRIRCGFSTLMGRDNFLVGRMVPLQAIIGTLCGHLYNKSSAIVQMGDRLAYLPTKWHLDPLSRLATTNMGRKVGAVPLWGGGAGSPSNTMWPGPRPTSMPSFILIHRTVWPQFTNVTGRQDRENRQTTVP